MNETNTTDTTNHSSGSNSGAGYRTAVRTAAVAGVFAIVVGVLLGYDYSRRQSGDPLEAEAFHRAKHRLGVVRVMDVLEYDNALLARRRHVADPLQPAFGMHLYKVSPDEAGWSGNAVNAGEQGFEP